MTALNLNWVKENFNKEEHFTFFDVGAADLEASIALKQLMPSANVYAFEAFDNFHEINDEVALKEGIHYHKGAVSAIDGIVTFYPSIMQGAHKHPFSGSIFKPVTSHVEKHAQVYGDSVTVDSIRLETFCKEHNITPDFIHIDVEGAEVKVLANMGNHKPKCIWAETCAFVCYDTNTSSIVLDYMLHKLGYYKVYSNGMDTLYCQRDFVITPYITKETA